jgi:hypothetical protein
MADGTMINLNLAGLPNDVSALNLYAVDPLNKVTLLGPVTVANGAATQTFTTPLNKFMLVLSPEANLTSVGATTPVVLRSAVPAGMAVVPLASSGERDGAAVGERVAAVAANTAYNVPMLGIPNWRRGTDTHMRVNFPSLGGSRANVFIEPRHDGPTQIRMRFHSLRRAPVGRLVLWAVGQDNTFTRLGQVVNSGRRNEAEIRTETAMPDFGLLVTVENVDGPVRPSGPVYATVIMQP